MDDINMKNMVIKLIAAELYVAMERFFVLNPPVDTTLKAWFNASKGSIPATQ